MTKILLIKHFLLFLLFSIVTADISAQNIAGRHRGNITSLIHNGNTVLSAGEDGFLVTWNTRQRTADERFQLTTSRIQSMVPHPVKNEICIIESSTTGDYRISAWNYSNKEKLFTLNSSAPVTYINYSAGGNFIIAAGLNGFPLTMINSVTGEIINEPAISSGNTVLALTGRAERNMLIYQSEHEAYSGRSAFAGLIMYLDLESMSVTSSFEAPGYILNPVVFGNNRFLAGINQDGLQVIDTTSGNVLDTMDISVNALLFPLNDGFYCLSSRNGRAVLYRFSVDRNGNLVTREQQSLVFENNVTIAGIAFNQNMVFATSQGNILLLERQNRLLPFNYHFQTRITEIAAGRNSIAFLTEKGQISFIPADYTLINNSRSLTFTDITNYNRLSYIPAREGEPEHFLLWQDTNTRTAPAVIGTNSPISANNLRFLLGRFPLRTISFLNRGNIQRLLTMDSAGNITIRNLNALFSDNAAAANALFNFSSAGAIDAGFINNENIVLSRSVINNNSPFLSINIRTGETVPYFFPSLQAGLSIYSGSSENIFAAAVEQNNDRFNTVFLNLASSSQISMIFDYPAEAHFYSMAESLSGHLAIACNSEGAIIFASASEYGNFSRITNFERTSGLPVKLFYANGCFISLDSEGNITWHDVRTGKILAAFSL